jgi:hypothetical protein
MESDFYTCFAAVVMLRMEVSKLDPSRDWGYLIILPFSNFYIRN